jgi:two-component system LytT family response regulator
MIKTIIIDDEPKIIKNIKNILYVYCKNVSVVAEAENVKSGVEAIKTHDPDLVLLDINMPDGSGFDLLEKIPQRNFLTIFITAYDEYAVKAIKYSAADYILKPIDKNELISAIDKIEKIKKGKNAKFINAKYELLFENLRSPLPKKSLSQRWMGWKF